jgi:hypothetical protein
MFKIKPLPNSGGDFALYYREQFVKAGTKDSLKSDIADTQSKPNEYKGVFHCLSDCTECCQQHVGVSQTELFRIRRAVRKLGETEQQRLKDQPRDVTCCPLLDIEKGVCSVYEKRPDICRDFGSCTGALSCSYNLDITLNDVESHFISMINDRNRDIVGRLGNDYTWEKGLL